MNSGLLILAMASLLGQANTAAPPDKIAKFLERSEASRKGALVELENQLRRLRNMSPRPPRAAEQIAQLESDIERLQANREPVVPPLRYPPEIGAIGRLPQLRFKVEQVVSADEMLVRCEFPIVVAQTRRYQTTGERTTVGVSLLLRGRPTAGLEPGSERETVEVFEITARRDFRAGNGRMQSVPVVELFDLRTLRKYFPGIGE